TARRMPRPQRSISGRPNDERLLGMSGKLETTGSASLLVRPGRQEAGPQPESSETQSNPLTVGSVEISTLSTGVSGETVHDPIRPACPACPACVRVRASEPHADFSGMAG